VQTYIATKDAQIENLKYLVSYLKGLKFDRKSEQNHSQIEQLFDEAEAIAAKIADAALQTTQVKTHPRKRGGRKAFPEHIPREILNHIVEKTELSCACCGSEMTKIGEEVNEQIEIVPIRILVQRHVRSKYSCKPCLNAKNNPDFKIAPLPPEILPKSIATAGLFAHVLTNKFCDHIPYYRQEKIFKRHEIDISAANLSNWQIQFYERFDRLEEILWRDILQSPVMLADETPLQVLRESGRRDDQKSWMFAFGTQNIRLFQYRETRSAGFLAQRLKNFEGTLVTDGFKSYDALCGDLKIPHAACWVHTRRKFIEANKHGPPSAFAAEILTLINSLYEIERTCRERNDSPEEHLKFRTTKSAPIIATIFEKLKAKRNEVPPSLPLGVAIQYALGQEEKLKVCLTNALIPLDTNAVENAIRPFVIGRKNWMFSGSPRGADSSALIYSLIETAKANDWEPNAYLKYLFEKLPLCNSEAEMRDLMPYRIAPSVVA
jgi:transposase